jgi:HD-GYP domain-containing protein (c-di-GMP phosphodiesterase class II)
VAMDRKTITLSTFHRNLALRVAAAGIVVSLFFGGVTWHRQRTQVIDIVLERVISGTRLFNQRIGYLTTGPDWPDPERVQAELDRHLREAPRGSAEREGRFIYIAILDREAGRIASQVDETYPHLEALRARRDELQETLKAARTDVYRTYRLDGIPYALTATPLFGADRQAIAYVQTIFAVSEEALQEAYGNVRRTVFSVIGIVLLTALLIYPSILVLTRRLGRLTGYLLDANLETLKVLGSAIAKRDSDTDAHNYRVTLYAVRTAEVLRLENQDIQSLIKGAFLHDVGKIGVRDNILLKPGKLDDREYAIMQQHVPHGLDIVARSRWLKDAVDVVGYHHEKFAGGGYDQGLRGEDIPITARIFAVADVFDALTSKRPYKEPFSYAETMDILEEGRRTHFDPGVLDAFASIAPRLYKELAGREDQAMKDALEIVIKRYFSADAAIPLGA